MNPRSHFEIKSIVVPAIVSLIAGLVLQGRTLRQFIDCEAEHRLDESRGDVLSDSATRSFFSRAMPQKPVLPELNFSSISPTTTPPRNSQY
jgi:hypothetical protein